jgi:hypothetical protein
MQKQVNSDFPAKNDGKIEFNPPLACRCVKKGSIYAHGVYKYRHLSERRMFKAEQPLSGTTMVPPTELLQFFNRTKFAANKTGTANTS